MDWLTTPNESGDKWNENAFLGYSAQELAEILRQKDIDLEEELLEIISINIWIFANDEEREIDNERPRKFAIYNRIFANFIKDKKFESIFDVENEYIIYHILKYFIQKWEAEIVQAAVAILKKKNIDINCPTLAFNDIEISSLDTALLRYESENFESRYKITKTLLENWWTSTIAKTFGSYEKFVSELKKFYTNRSAKIGKSFYANYNKLYKFFSTVKDDEFKKTLIGIIWEIKRFS